jgi:hypothetical protein
MLLSLGAVGADRALPVGVVLAGIGQVLLVSLLVVVLRLKAR